MNINKLITDLQVCADDDILCTACRRYYEMKEKGGTADCVNQLLRDAAEALEKMPQWIPALDATPERAEGELRMTRQQAKIILAFAENDMQIRATAKRLYMSDGNVTYHLKKIKEQLGWNPRKFYDLCYLVGVAAQRLGGRPEDGK